LKKFSIFYLFALFLFACGTGFSQVSYNVVISSGAGVPTSTGAVCRSGQQGFYIDYVDASTFSCNSGTWTQTSGGGGGATFPGTNGLVKNTSTTASVNAVDGTDYLSPSTGASLSGATFTGQISSPLVTSNTLQVFPVSTCRNQGDSITHGVGASSIGDNYPNIISNYLGIPCDNQSVPGAKTTDQELSIFAIPAADFNSSGLITYLIGTNNVSVDGGNNANIQASFATNFLAQGAWMAIPPAIKHTAQSGSFTYTGTWSTGSNYSTIEEMSSTAGATATFSVTGSIIYLVSTMVNSGTGTGTLVCDSVSQGTINFFPVGSVSLPSATAATQMTRVSGLSNTTHSCTVTQTAGTIYLDWYAGINGTTPANAPVVLLGATPPRNPTDVITPNYNALQVTDVATLFGDGLRVYYVNDTTGWVAANYYDNLHFNDYGYYLMAQFFISSINTNLLSKPLPTRTWQINSNSSILYNNAQFGSLGSLGIGYNTLVNASFTGSKDVAIGASNMQSATTASFNTAVGVGVLTGCTTCGSNTGIGQAALGAVTTGSGNVGVGINALALITTQSNNTAVGIGAMNVNSSATNDVAVGAFSQQNGVGGNQLTSVGGFSFNSATGARGAALGYQAGQLVTTANDTTVVGNTAGAALTTGSGNTILGSASGGAALTTQTNCTALGYQATIGAGATTNCTTIGQGSTVNASNTMVFGNSSVTSWLSGSGLSFIPVSNTTATLTNGASTTITCTSATCTNLRGTVSIVGSSAGTGTISSLSWTATPTAYVCGVDQNGGATYFGIGNSVATTTGINITADVSLGSNTVVVNYSCRP